MERENARRIIQSREITYGQIQDMLRAAYDDDNYLDQRPSKSNKNLSTAYVFNICWKVFKNKDPSEIITWDDELTTITPSIVEFGEFGPREWQVNPKPEIPTPIHHQEPVNPYEEL